MVQRFRPVHGATCAVVLTLAAPGLAHAAPRPCTAQDLQGSRAPAMLRDHGLDTQDGPLVAATRYRVVVVQELAFGDEARPVDGSVVVSAPNGPALQPTTEDDRPAYDFTPPAAGSVRLVVSWQDEVGPSGSGDICQASQSFDIAVVAPALPTVAGRFRRGGHALGSSFLLQLHGTSPQVPGTVEMILRARRGTTRPPAPRGRALGRFRFVASADGDFEARSSVHRLAHTFTADTTGSGIEIYPEVNIPFGRKLRFAFSVEVVQDGKRLGGLSSGATCRRIQFRGHSAVKCRAVGLRKQP